MKSDGFVSMGRPFGVMEVFWNLVEVVVVQHYCILNVIKLFTLRWCICVM